MFSSHRKFFVLTLILALLFSAAVFARGSGETSSDDGTVPAIELADYFGRKVVLGAPAQKVVSLAPGITETVFALGYGDRLVGRTSYCDYPADVASVADVGTLTEPDLEAIIASDPDLVIGSTHFSEESLAMLENAGLTVAVLLGPDTFDGVYDGIIRPIAAAFGDVNAGEALVERMRTSAAEASEKALGITDKPSVYYVVGFGEGGDWTAGGDTVIGQMIEKAGGRNIAGDTSGWAFSAEAIVHRDPDLILIPAWASGMFEATEPYSGLRAVRNGDVYVIDENAIVRQGPRIAEGYASLVDIFASRSASGSVD